MTHNTDSGQPVSAFTPDQEDRLAQLARLPGGMDGHRPMSPLDPKSLALARSVGTTLALRDASLFMTHDGELALSWVFAGGSVEAVFTPS